MPRCSKTWTGSPNISRHLSHVPTVPGGVPGLERSSYARKSNADMTLRQPPISLVWEGVAPNFVIGCDMPHNTVCEISWRYVAILPKDRNNLFRSKGD